MLVLNVFASSRSSCKIVTGRIVLFRVSDEGIGKGRSGSGGRLSRYFMEGNDNECAEFVF